MHTAVTQGRRIGGDVPQGRLWVESRPRRLRPCGPVRSCGPVPFAVTGKLRRSTVLFGRQAVWATGYDVWATFVDVWQTHHRQDIFSVRCI